ncbi:MAG: hypothetical protein K0U38_00200 [Epsilonproteobacteria bacterium]|nr:hypothetical protein [Campylobacterota bacterium]
MKKIIISSIITSTILLTGCGGGSSNPTAENSPSANDVAKKTGVGHYVDAAVQGVEYECGEESGITDNNGTFTFEEGKNCIFTLGDVVLREVNATDLEDKMILLEDNLDTSRLLQTLDNDGDGDNGIEVSQNMLENIKTSDLTQLPIGDAELADFFQNIEGVEGYEGAMVTIEEAQQHLQQTIEELNLPTDMLDDMNISEEGIESIESEIDNLLDGLG